MSEPPSLRKVVPVVLAVVGLLAIALLVRPRHEDNIRLDPRSTGPDGAKALVDVLRELGAAVSISARPPGPEVRATLVLGDTLDPGRRTQLLGWVQAGGVLVMADPASTITGVRLAERHSAAVGTGDDVRLAPDCPLAALRDVAQIAVPGGDLMANSTGSVTCFPGRDGAWLVSRPEGAGTVVTLAGPDVFVNRALGRADNAVLLTSLVAPVRGGTVRVLTDFAADADSPPTGRRSLWYLVPWRVKLALLGVLLALVVYALYRGRRLGRPVVEPQPVELPGSELVVAVGHLLHQGQHRQQAASTLVVDARRTLADLLGLPPSAPPELLARVASARTGMAPEHVMMAVAPPPPANEADLVRLAQSVRAVSEEVAHAR